MRKMILCLGVCLCLSGPGISFCQDECVFELREAGNPLNLQQLREIDFSGSLTILMDFDQTPDSFAIDYEVPRTGSEAFAQHVLNTVLSWRYSDCARGKAYMEVSARNRHIKLDLTDVGKQIRNLGGVNSDPFPNIDDGKERYVNFIGFPRDRVLITLHPSYIQQQRESKGFLSNLYESIGPGFFGVFAFFGGVIIYLLIRNFLIFKNKKRLQGEKEKIELAMDNWREAFRLTQTVKNNGVSNGGRNHEFDKKVLPVLEQALDALGVKQSGSGAAKTTTITRPGDKDGDTGHEHTDGNGMPDSAFGRILYAGIQNHIVNRAEWFVSQEIDRAVDRATDNEVNQLKQRGKLDWLWAIGGIAPMLGLLGTVMGIANSFNEVSRFGSILQEGIMTKLAEGINLALYTTIVGLIIGLSAVVFYYLVKFGIDKRRSEWERSLVEITNKH